MRIPAHTYTHIARVMHDYVMSSVGGAALSWRAINWPRFRRIYDDLGRRSYELTFATAKPAAATRQLLSPPSTACKSDPNRDSIAIRAEDVRRADATLSKALTRARQSSCKSDNARR